MADDAVLTVVMQILAGYSLFLLIFGTLTSVLNILVCLRRRLRKNNTFVVLIFNSISDSGSLYCWNFDRFINYFDPRLSYEGTSLSFCKFIVWLQFFSLDWSSWLLVSSFEGGHL